MLFRYRSRNTEIQSRSSDVAYRICGIAVPWHCGPVALWHCGLYPSCQRSRYDTTMLLSGATRQQEFNSVLLNKFQVLEELLEEDTINDKWQATRESFTSTCKEVLGPEKQHHKEWISAETLKKIEGKKAETSNRYTRAGKARAYEEHSHARKIVKKSIKADNRDCTDMMATETEEAAL